MWLLALVICLSLRLLAGAISYISRWRTRRRYSVAPSATIIGFFHPFCAGGGGGERVLWRAVHTLSHLPKEVDMPLHVLIYTGDLSMKPEEILSGVSRQFDITIDVAAVPVSFVYLRGRGLLDALLYPVFTMLAQSVASAVVAVEALFRGTPDVFIDTTGYAFSFPVAWCAGCTVGTYVHYPTISTDMLSRVRNQRPSHNNSDWIASSVTVSKTKLLYYRAFARLYGIAGGCFSSKVMVNSSWTKGHIAALWKLSPPPSLVFPPCDTSELEALPINDRRRERCALSVGQFRPEKDHALQVRALAALRKLPSSRSNPSLDDVGLVILGSCRNDSDREVLRRTQELAVELGLEDRVKFVVNCSFNELKAWLGRASVGLHTMWNEHFGIGVVEMMAAGMVTIAHRSGGPEADIVVPLSDGRITGFLAETPEEYAEAMARVFGSQNAAYTTGTGSSGSEGVRTEHIVQSGVGGSIDLSCGDGSSCVGLVGTTEFGERGGYEEEKTQRGGGENGIFSIEAIRVAGRESARRFSNDVFDRTFAVEFVDLLQRRRPVNRTRRKEE